MLYFASAIGILFCIFWIVQLVFVKLHLNWTNTMIETDKSDENVGVSVIHPIKDLDFELEKNLDSWMNQVYSGPVQHIFSFQDPDDPAINVIKNVMSKYPHIDMTITVNPIIQGINGKSSNMVHGMKLSKYDIVMFGDSDVRVKRDFLVKMVRPLKDEKVGVTTCGQINIGGTDFWTRFFTFVQNSETDLMWALFTKLGFDVGVTGAAFAMRKKLLEQIGGLEAFGGSLLEDLHLGNTLYKMGYKIVLGPYIECYVDRFGKEKAINYGKKMGIGIKAHIAWEMPAFILMLSWYWILFILSFALQDVYLFSLSVIFMGLKTIHGLAQRVVTMNKILPVDLMMGVFFDLFGTFYLICAFNKPYVTWRGIQYEVKAGGFIEDYKLDQSEQDDEIISDEEVLEEQAKN